MELQVRKATWLELFYDLVFVVAIAKAVHVLGHAHNGHIAANLYGKYVLIIHATLVPTCVEYGLDKVFGNIFR